MNNGPVLVSAHRLGAGGRVMRPFARPPGRLTPRHVQIITLISHGRTNAQIGALLGLCDRTIKTEITHACKVLRVKNRAHLASTALRRGLIR